MNTRLNKCGLNTRFPLPKCHLMGMIRTNVLGGERNPVKLDNRFYSLLIEQYNTVVGQK